MIKSDYLIEQIKVLEKELNVLYDEFLNEKNISSKNYIIKFRQYKITKRIRKVELKLSKIKREMDVLGIELPFNPYPNRLDFIFRNPSKNLINCKCSLVYGEVRNECNNALI